MLINCKKASELKEKSNLFQLSLTDKLKLIMHNAICKACFSYEKQSKTMDGLLQKYYGPQGQIPVKPLNTEDLKLKITSEIDKAT